MTRHTLVLPFLFHSNCGDFLSGGMPSFWFCHMVTFLPVKKATINHAAHCALLGCLSFFAATAMTFYPVEGCWLPLCIYFLLPFLKQEQQHQQLHFCTTLNPLSVAFLADDTAPFYIKSRATGLPWFSTAPLVSLFDDSFYPQTSCVLDKTM